MGTWLIALISPLPVKIFLLPKLGISVEELIGLAANVNPYLISGICLMIFGGSMIWAMKMPVFHQNSKR
jgi:hypothetical protein